MMYIKRIFITTSGARCEDTSKANYTFGTNCIVHYNYNAHL